MVAVIRIKARIGDREQTFRGRKAWCLDRLLNAGPRGVTPLEYPAPRWSDYVFKLRRDGLTVETITEKHGGPYSGDHARYVLRTPVTVIEAETKP